MPIIFREFDYNAKNVSGLRSNRLVICLRDIIGTLSNASRFCGERIARVTDENNNKIEKFDRKKKKCSCSAVNGSCTIYVSESRPFSPRVDRFFFFPSRNVFLGYEISYGDHKP